jgi:hypothetical protein
MTITKYNLFCFSIQPKTYKKYQVICLLNTIYFHHIFKKPNRQIKITVNIIRVLRFLIV